MQEKDIRNKLNQELEQMAPDMLNKILSTPMEPVKDEKELFGKDRPLFKERKNWKPYLKVPAIALMSACLVALIILLYPMLGMNNKADKMAFSILIDVNPSICIEVNEDGTIKNVRAKNKDAKNIVSSVNSELSEDDDYKTAMVLVIRNLRREGYLRKKKNAMLVSAIPVKEKNDITEQLKEIKRRTNEQLEIRDIQCKTVYQTVRVTNKVKKVARKNNVSVGKAALCIELAKEEKVSVNQMCKSNIDHLVEKIEENHHMLENGVIVVDDSMEIVTEETSVEAETVTVEVESTEIPTETIESESVSETIEHPAESTAGAMETEAVSVTTGAY